MFRVSAIALLVALLSTTSQLFAVPLDFDQNGISNPSTVHIKPNNTLAWHARFGSDNQTINNSFGRSGNHLATAKYTSSAAQIATINGDGEWNVFNLGSFTHGTENALYLAGADFDGNGQADAAYANNVCLKKATTVHFKINPFSTNNTQTLVAGRGYDHHLYLDVNNDGRDDICWAEPISRNRRLNGKFNLICRDVLTKDRVAKFYIGKIYSAPVPLRNAQTADYVVTQHEKGAQTLVSIFNTNGKLVRRVSFGRKGTLVVGQFVPGNSEQVVIVNDNNQGLLYNLETKSFEELVFPAGIPYDHFNANYFSTKSKAAVCFCDTKVIKRNQGKCQSTKEFGSGGAPASENFRDGNEGNLWKPVAESGYPAHNNKLVVLLHNRYQQIFDYCEVPLKNGNMHRLQIHAPYEFTNPDRQTWRSTINCDQAAEVFVSCSRGSQTVTFSVDSEDRGEVCTRHD